MCGGADEVQTRTQWHDLIGRHCPRFAQDRTVVLPLPRPVGYLGEEEYKLALSFEGAPPPPPATASRTQDALPALLSAFAAGVLACAHCAREGRASQASGIRRCGCPCCRRRTDWSVRRSTRSCCTSRWCAAPSVLS